jgi:hypothetical protein
VTTASVAPFTKEKGPSEFHERPKSREETPKEGCEARAELTYRTAKTRGAAHHQQMRFAHIWFAQNAQLALFRLEWATATPALGRATHKERPSVTERPKSREETPKLGYESEEACQRDRQTKMIRFAPPRNLDAYCISTLDIGCIRPATSSVTIVYLNHQCSRARFLRNPP